MALILGYSFKGVFEKYDISKKDVIETYSLPNQVESLDNGITLYLKSHKNNDEKRNFLFLATQINKGEDLLAFAYWIPTDLVNEKSSLLGIWEIFVNRFGLKIRIGTEEGYFIKRSRRLIYGKIENPNDLIEILAPQQIPCEYFLFTNENLIGTINTVTLYYSFALNTSKYLFWLNSIPFVQLEIKAGWYEFVKNIVDYVEPHGKTKIKTLKQRSTEKLDDDTSDKKVSIEVPKNYENQFRYITKTINDLKNKEKILFKLSFSSPRCLFCDSSQTSSEHIFPIWLKPYLPETIFEGTKLSNFGNESFIEMMDSSLTPGKKESSKGYTTNLVCESCNNTWMSLLENQVKTILIPNDKILDIVPQNISKKDSELLSQWLILKSLLLSNKLFSNIHELPGGIFREIKNGNLNKGFLVEMIRAENFKVDFFIGKGLLFDKLYQLKNLPLDKAKKLANNFFICCIQLGHLLFRVSYLNSNNPLSRETALVDTFKLLPLDKEVKHRRIKDDTLQWAKVVDANLEIHLFAQGLLLVE